ncbi:tetratricopeptide repeat protein [Streptomyces puniciscabiei]|uniref:tetratricopeptide repeat protein n=1 Tax=Streptomyces puniciscabiei TaxID=164348 RepID=UPI003324060F
MSKTPDFFEDLRWVGALKRDRLGGRPSDNALSKAPKPPVARDTVGAWLRGARFPQQVEPLLSVLREIRAEAARQGRLEDSAGMSVGESVADLLAEGRWRRSWAAEQQRRIQADREGVERHQAHKALEDEERRARQAALRDRPRPVRSWSLQRLGVHAAIPGRADPGGTGFVVPAYVPRPHDHHLRARLAGAVTDEDPLLVVVRGKSCTGKTRTAAEALKAVVPDDFQLLFPASADDLLAALAADALGPRSVLWLNEAQNYLDGLAGEAVAAALLRRLDAPGPCLIIATLWPDHDEALTAAPVPGADDPHRQARMLLAQAHYTHLPNSFADALDAVRRAADHDASLAAALESGDADLTQTLAAGPDLVTHYEHPAGTHGIYGKALISAAMDAHRLGVTAPLPLDFLRHAAPGYLTDGERAAADPDTWFTGALTHAQTLIKQIARPLQNVPRSSGMGALPGVVRLADYLQQHGRRARRHLCPPAAFWKAAAEHVTAPADLARLADAAERRYRYRQAAQLYCAAADSGDPVALVSLARMRGEVGDREGAERLARAAAYRGRPSGLALLARRREEAGDREEAERLARAAADSGDSFSLVTLAQWREEAGDREEAERLYRAAADSGNPFALMTLALWREEAGDREEAERLVRASAGSGGNFALALLARRLGTGEEAEWLYRAAADSGNSFALVLLAKWREEAGDGVEAERLARAAADSGQPSALVLLAKWREEAGDGVEAERLARAAADSGDLITLVLLAKWREEAGDREEAERLYRVAANRGQPSALILLAQSREEAGDREEAERLYRAAADRGNPSALMTLAQWREEAGDGGEAERLARAAADSGNLFALEYLAELRQGAVEEYQRYGLEANGTLAEPWAWPEPRAIVSDAP